MDGIDEADLEIEAIDRAVRSGKRSSTTSPTPVLPVASQNAVSVPAPVAMPLQVGGKFVNFSLMAVGSTLGVSAAHIDQPGVLSMQVHTVHGPDNRYVFASL